MGCGAIGGTTAAHLTEVGADVTGVTTNHAIAKAVSAHGYRITGHGGERTVAGQIAIGIPERAVFDLVILATQPPQVEDAARAALPHLAPDGHMIVFQNGLCEDRVAAVIGGDGPPVPEQVIGGIVAWGASMPEPGVYDRTAAGGFTLGKVNAEPDDACREVGGLLEAIGPVQYTANLSGARWSKLALNCAISSLGTIAGERLGPLVRVRRVRRLALEIFTEVVAVARAENIRLEKVSGTLDLEWIALSDAEREVRGSAGLTAKHALLLAVGLRYRRMRSSMLQAIERGRVPAIDFLNGEVVTRGRTHGIATPVNDRIVRTIHAIARGEESFSRELIDRIYQETR